MATAGTGTSPTTTTSTSRGSNVTPKKTSKPTPPKAGGGAVGFNPLTGSVGTIPSFIFPNVTTLLGWGLNAHDAGFLANKSLQVAINHGKFAGGAPTSNAKLQDAMRALFSTLPNAYSVISNKYGLPPNPNAKDFGPAVSTLYSNLISTGGNFTSIDPKANYSSVPIAVAQGKELADYSASRQAQANAYDNVKNTLMNWGIDSSQMDSFVKGLVTNTSGQLVNQDALLDQVRSYVNPATGKSPYQEAFPGLVERNTKGTLDEHMTEAQYQQYVSTVQGVAGQYLPAGTLTKTMISDLVQNNVSASEFQERVTKGYLAAVNADANTKTMLSQYGINTQDLAAYFLDPGSISQGFGKATATGQARSLNTVEQNVAAATIAGYAQGVGLNGLSQSGARELADRVNLGAGSAYGSQSMSSINNALLSASKDSQLMGVTPGAQGTPLDVNTMIGSQVAGFQGTSQVQAQAAVMRAEQARVAPFEKGGGYAETAKGVTGLGSAKQ